MYSTGFKHIYPYIMLCIASFLLPFCVAFCLSLPCQMQSIWRHLQKKSTLAVTQTFINCDYYVFNQEWTHKHREKPLKQKWLQWLWSQSTHPAFNGPVYTFKHVLNFDVAHIKEQSFCDQNAFKPNCSAIHAHGDKRSNQCLLVHKTLPMSISELNREWN